MTCRRGEDDALDNCSDLVGSLGARVGDLLHDRRIHPHPARPGGDRRAGPRRPGTASPMKRLMAAALLLAFASAPSLARAATINGGPPAAVTEARGEPQSATYANAAPGDTADYAARE